MNLKHFVPMLAAVCVTGVASAQEEGLLFHASFDNHFDADFAAGDAKGKPTGSAEGYFVPGMKNQALKIGYDEKGRLWNVNFSAAKNVQAKSGTVSLYFKPDNWSKCPKKFQHLLTLTGKKADGKNKSFLCYRIPSKGLGAWESESKITIVGAMNTIEDGNWHHYALTWESGKEITLYLDGRKVDQKKFVAADLRDFDAMTIGTIFWKENIAGTGAVDEVKIYNKVLSAAEISALAAICPESANQDGFNFIASYKNGFNADFASGNAQGTPCGSAEKILVSSDKDKALVAGWLDGKRTGVSYVGFRNATPASGTLILRFQPKDWQANINKYQHLVTFFGDPATAVLYQNGSNRIALYAAKKTLLQFPASGIKDGQWYRLVLTWDKSGTKLYLDGKLVASGSWPFDQTNQWNEIFVGGLGWTAQYCVGSTLIDEVKISKRVLSADEIAALK